MTDEQQGDVLIFQTADDGDIEVFNGIATMGGGLEGSVYLSLFGGNQDDDGLQDNPFSWWANLMEIDPARQYRSETQNLLAGIPAIPFNLRRIEKAVVRDLAWMITVKAADNIEADARILPLNKIKIVVKIEAVGLESEFEFVQNWRVSL